MSLKLYRWNNQAVPGAYTGRLQYIEPDEWEGFLDRHLTEVDEGTVPEKQLIRLWVEAGQAPESFDSRHGSPDDEYYRAAEHWAAAETPDPIVEPDGDPEGIF